MLNLSDFAILGDNPLYGVDHLSQERSRAKINDIGNIEKIIPILESSVKKGVRGFVVSTRPELKILVDYLQKNKPELIEELEFYPIIPYLQRYVTKMTEKGVMGTLQDILGPASTKDKIKLVTKGGIGFLKKDLGDLIKLFVDIELLNLQGCKIKRIFFHDAIVDLALSLGLKDLFVSFIEHIQKKYHAEVGLVTKNPALLLKQFKSWKLEMPVIMMAFNKIGFQMNPSKTECEQIIQEYNPTIIAMSTLAAGYLKPQEAFEYCFKFPQIKQIVIGMSSTSLE